MNLNDLRSVQMSLNKPKAKMCLNEPKWAQKTLNVFKMSFRYEVKIGLNELKSALISPNFNKTFTSDAYTM